MSGKTVLIVIADSAAHSETAKTHTSLFRDVGERPVAIVFIKRRCAEASPECKKSMARCSPGNVHPAIVIVIEKRTAGPHWFQAKSG